MVYSVTQLKNIFRISDNGVYVPLVGYEVRSESLGDDIRVIFEGEMTQDEADKKAYEFLSSIGHITHFDLQKIY